MLLVLEDPVIVHEMVILINQLMIAQMIVIIVISVSRLVRRVKDRLCSSAPVPRSPVCLSLTLAEDEAIQDVHIISVPIHRRPEVRKSCDLVNQSPEEEDQGNDSDYQPVHFSSAGICASD